MLLGLIGENFRAIQGQRETEATERQLMAKDSPLDIQLWPQGQSPCPEFPLSFRRGSGHSVLFLPPLVLGKGLVLGIAAVEALEGGCRPLVAMIVVLQGRGWRRSPRQPAGCQGGN